MAWELEVSGLTLFKIYSIEFIKPYTHNIEKRKHIFEVYVSKDDDKMRPCKKYKQHGLT